MSLAPGTRLGPYEITAPIGAGGMGEVYRARDTKLDRDVAVKVLPEAFAEDSERLARFEREAKLLASLNHPHIAGIYGLEDSGGTTALVLELVDGQTLAERIREGPIPVDEAVAIAKQIAEALEAGHDVGVIHRDLKPANVKLKEDGTVKVLDYGLAKALDGDSAADTDSHLSQSPTLTRQGTQLGMVLGTAAYMSPEQAKGKKVDRRADIWALGAVLYEMLTARRAFDGEDVSDTLAAVLRAEPDFDALPADTSPGLRRALEVCLTRDLKQRFQAIGDVRLALEGQFVLRQVETGEQNVGAWHLRNWVVVGAAVILAGLLLGSVVSRVGAPDVAPRSPVRFTFALPDGVSVDPRLRSVAVSPDGSQVAVATSEGVWHRELSALEGRFLPGTENARSPFFSPDGEWLAFFTPGKLQKVSLQGGIPTVVSDDSILSMNFGGHWERDGTLIFGSPSGVKRVAETGGDAESLVTSASWPFASEPQMLPGEDAILYRRSPGFGGGPQIVARRLTADDDDVVVLLDEAGAARYLPTGHLVYFQQGTLFAARFDPGALALEGSGVPLVTDIRRTRSSAHMDISDTGTLVYLRSQGSEDRTLVWVDREGNEEPLPLPPAETITVTLSPDGTRLAMGVQGQEGVDIWLFEIVTGTLSRFTFHPAPDSDPVWSPDGERIYFSSARDGARSLYWKSSDGSGTVTRLTESANTQWPQGFTPDGRMLLVDVMGENTSQDIFYIDLTTNRSSSSRPELVPFLTNEERERLPVVSPNGRFVAYEVGTPSGRQVFLRTFPDGDGLQQVSNDGGASPKWSPDGRELFYLNQGALMAVTVEADPAFRIVGTRKLFEGDYVDQSHNYAVTDGKRFLMTKLGGATTNEIVVVLDWFEEVKQRVP